MADELRLNVSVAFTKGGASFSKTIAPLLDISGDLFVHGVQNIGTTEETLTLIAGIGTLGYVLVYNLDDTNFIEIGAVTTEYAIKLKPGEIALFRVNGSAIYAKADTAACDLEYAVIED